MKNRTLILLYVAIAVNLALALLPIYDSFNTRCWVALGSSITSSAPTMANNAWPGGFFTFMAFTPMYLTYVYSGFNYYASIVALKLILFIFTLLTAFLLYRITQKIKPAYADIVLLFTLLNPAILYINYFWTQLDILPVFFFILGFALLRYVDFGGSNWKRYLVGFFPIMISAFIYRYSLILIPALILFDSGTSKQKLSGLIVAVGEAAALFSVELLLFRGQIYNYAGALAGSVINMSGVEGFQYWLSIPQVPYIAFLLVLGIIVPVILKALKYDESAALFFILLIFIYTSSVPLADYFLWLYPISIILILRSSSKLSLSRKLLLTGLPLYLGLFFISFIIGNGIQSGPFYFAYPLLHQDISLIASTSLYDNWVLLFNLVLLGSVIAASIFCLSKSNRFQGTQPTMALIKPIKFTRRKNAVLAVLVIVVVLLSISFNAFYAQPITASNEQVYPLDLFPANNHYDSMPMGSTYYLSWNGLLVFNNGSGPISFNHALNLQNIDLNVDFNLTADIYGNYNLLTADNYTMGIDLQPTVSTFNLTTVEPSGNSSSDSQQAVISTFDEPVALYSFNSTSSVNYQLNQSDIGDYYAVAFKFTNSDLPQSLLFHFSNSEYIFDYSISNTLQWAFYYDQTYHNSTTAASGYSMALEDGWNLVVFKPTAKGFTAWVNNQSFTVEGRFFSEDTALQVTSYYTGKSSQDAGGYVSQLYSCASKPVAGTDYVFYVDVDSTRHIEASIDSSELNLNLVTSSDGGTLTVGGYSWPIESLNSVAFGKLTYGVYGLTLTLNYLELSQKSYGYYLVPVYFAVVVPFAVTLLSLPLLFRRRGTAAD